MCLNKQPMDQLNFEGKEDKPILSPIRIKSIRTVHGLNSIAEQFPKELKEIAIEQLLQVDASAEMLMNHIKSMRPNMIVIKKDGIFICIDLEIHLEQFIALRHKKLVASGTYEQVQEVVCEKLKKEWDGKVDNLTAMEIDEDWLKSFCKMHYNKETVYKIIKL